MTYYSAPPITGCEAVQPISEVGAQRAPEMRTQQLAQSVLVALLYSIPALIAAHAAAIADPDIWWHLRSGEWMMHHRSVPRTDVFSAGVAGTPWAAYSWLFELLAFQLFRWLGVVGIVALTSTLLLAITVALHHMVRTLQRDFSVAVLLTFTSCLSLGRLYTPRPWLFTVLFFVLELHILMQVRRTGRSSMLAWLPLLFALWTNLHIQFVNGLVVMVLACAESLFGLRRKIAFTKARPLPMLGAGVACLLATVCNPYGWRIYQVAYGLAAQPGVLNKVQELQAIPFRELPDWAALAMALGAIAALARARSFLPFESGLMLLAVVLAFRSQRDVWMLSVATAAILASQITLKQEVTDTVPTSRIPLLTSAALLALLIGFRVMSLNRTHLTSLLVANMPVHAVEFAQAQRLPGPIFNSYGWGGYLIWALRLPVSIDGRANLYGDQRIDRSDDTWNGHPDWSTDANLKASGMVIGPVNAPLTQILRTSPGYQLAYEDKLTAVFVHRRR